MHTSFWTALKLTAAAALAALVTVQPATAADTLRFGGTGSSIGMLGQVGADFAAAGGVRIEVVPSLGSSGGIHAMLDGKIDLAVSARPLKPKESAAGAREVLVLRTPFVLATSHPAPGGMKAADVLKAFAAKQPTWPDAKPIRIILRPRSEADTRLLGEMVPGMVEALEAARRRSEVPTAATDQDNADLAQTMPGSLTATTLTQLTTERRDLRVVPIDGVAPTLANFASGAYPYGKRLHFILGPKSGPVAERFVTFLQSPEGVKALRAAAVLPVAE